MRHEIYHKTIQNPQASMPLVVPIMVICNTADDVLRDQVRANSARDLRWVKAEEPHSRPAIMIGGGPSVAESLDDIRRLVREGGVVFAMNGASKYIRGHGIAVDYQVIVDAKAETAQLVDPSAREHLLASQVHPSTLDAVPRAVLWHLALDDDMEALFPSERVKSGGYALLGGGAAVGNCALCVAFALGHRELHIFGYDSCHRQNASHAYSQPMNDLIPTVDTEWGGKVYTSSVAMKAQAEKFQITAQSLKQEGCKLHVYGEGLLQAMYLTPAESLTERDKYRRLWQTETYRAVSPGEAVVAEFLNVVRPDGLIADFGCGTGRAAVALSNAGHRVVLVDFADNCRDADAQSLPFLEWDLTRPCPISAPFGFCADVMEHIPPSDVDRVIRTIMGSAGAVFFQISTTADVMGALIGQSLHLSVHPPAWWQETFKRLGFAVAWSAEDAISCRFVVTRNPSDGEN